MKIGEFFKSKRNQTIIFMGLVQIIVALFPEKFAPVSNMMQSAFGMQ